MSEPVPNGTSPTEQPDQATAMPPPEPIDATAGNTAAAAAPDDDDGDSSTGSEPETTFVDDAVAEGARAVGLAAYNGGDFDSAVRIQAGLMKHFTGKYGEVAAKCAIYYLDYGITLLAIVQGAGDNETAALGRNDGEESEDVALCFSILELARVCFDKVEDEAADEAAIKEVQKRQAEVHEALGQLHVEREDENEALKEFEYCLVLRQAAAAAPNERAVVLSMFQIGHLYLRAQEFGKAEASLTEALALAQTNPDMPADLVDELTSFLEEAKEFKLRGIETVKREIRDLFTNDAAEQAVLQPDGGNAAAPTNAAGSGNGLISALPAGLEGSSRAAPSNMVQAVPMREASSSMSFFPRQCMSDPERSTGGHASGSASLTVNTSVPVRKKERARPAGQEAAPAAAKPPRSEGQSGEPAAPQ